MFGRLICAVITPFTITDEIDYKAFKNIINYVYDTGSDAIVIGGSTGEGHLLTLTEKVNLIQSAISFAPKNLKIIGAIGEIGTNETLEMVRMLNAIPLDAVLISVPHYVLPNQEGIYRHFKEIDKISEHPIIIYNVPSRVGTSINKETMLFLRKHCKNIVGIKHASKDVEYIKFLKEHDPQLLVYTGNDGSLLNALNAKADGIISVGANAFGQDFKEVIENHFLNINDEPLKNYISIISDLLEIDTNPIVIKYIMSRKGLCYNILRLPLVSLNEKLQEKINDLLGY